MIQAPVFDKYVNAGSHAIKVLQRTLNLFDTEVSVDAYGIERVNYYLSLADARPNLRKFARTRRGEKGGWIKRAEKYIRPRFHLSATTFQQRTATWG